MSMSGTTRASAGCLTVAALLASATFGDHAFAKTKRQPSMPSAAVATATRPMALSNAEQPPAAAAPVRFFTINQVLAKRDGRSDPDTGKLAAATSANTTTDAPGPLVTRRGDPSSEPFGLLAFQAPQGLLWVKWRRVEQQIDDEAETLRSCHAEPENCASTGAKTFLAIVADAKRWEGRARIEVVNRLVNASIRYESDMAQHGVVDLWSPPLATLGSGRGDCEDYAIAKYAALRAAGTSDENLRLLLVRDRAVGQDHAVLAVRHADTWLVLDNRYALLKEASELSHFTPLFALNHGGVKLFAAPYVMRPADDDAIELTPATSDANNARAAATGTSTIPVVISN